MKNVLIIISLFFTISCSSIFKEEYRVTGAYKVYKCPEGFERITNFGELNYDGYYHYSTPDTCTQGFIDGYGCAFVIDDSILLDKIVQNYDLPIQDRDSAFWNTNTKTILGFKKATNPGSRLYDSIFFCINHSKEEYLLKCQYEIRDQCAWHIFIVFI